MLRNGFKFFSAVVLACLIYFVGFQQGCSPVSFVDTAPLSCDEFPERSRCQRMRIEIPDENSEPPYEGSDDPIRVSDARPSKYYWQYDYEMSLGDVAVVIIVDPSSSMAKIHRTLGRQIAPALTDMKYLKYNLALTTTDISASPNNPYKGTNWQDGQFIKIGNKDWLTNENLGENPDRSIVAQFKQALEREETQKCDTQNQPKRSSNPYDRLYEGEIKRNTCPSSDERGIYAANLAIENRAYQSFFNPDHIMFIVVSDEDERSGLEFRNQFGFESEYALEEKDTPEFLVYNIYQRFSKTKTMSWHSIIIPPGDSECLQEQNRDRGGGEGTGRGYYGREYAKLSEAKHDLQQYGNLLKGTVISICDRNYGSQLGKITLYAQKLRVPLPCTEPKEVSLFVNNQKIRAETEIEGRTLYVSANSGVTLSAKVKVRVICEEENVAESTTI